MNNYSVTTTDGLREHVEADSAQAAAEQVAARGADVFLVEPAGDSATQALIFDPLAQFIS